MGSRSSSCAKTKRPAFISHSFREKNPESMAKTAVEAEIENAHDEPSTRAVIEAPSCL
jgi:hypothetical protein